MHSRVAVENVADSFFSHSAVLSGIVPTFGGMSLLVSARCDLLINSVNYVTSAVRTCNALTILV